MAAASSSSLSGSGCHRWKYDVFLNFRGEDTRKIFIGHLYNALVRNSIDTFIDAEELRKGNDLSQLLTAIQESRVSIVVFSENYASSTWCLKELVQILECRDTENQIVLPVFYEIDPSHVRKRKRSFKEAFKQHKCKSNTDNKEVRSWRSALTKAANLGGWDSRHYKDDAKLIEDIVGDILKKLINISPSENNGLVEMDFHLEKMDSLLCPELKDIHFVGIWGMGGIGKTTIARAVYDRVNRQFEGCCFLEDVKGRFPKVDAGQQPVDLQAELLTSITNNKVGRADILSRGFRKILERVGKKKILLVLDNVENSSQIEALIGKQPSFGGGSRIIITTRDKQSLCGVGESETYEPKLLGDDEALELFEQYAFRTKQPTEEHLYMSGRFTKYAKGLPLALKVLGSFLDNKSVVVWNDELKKLKRNPHEGIQKVLRTSFDGLDPLQKKIFLDIACFFIGMGKDFATRIMEGCGFYPCTGLDVLIGRGLVAISCNYSRLEMHDLVHEMGLEIIRQESVIEPGRRSRLWSYDDIDHVLTKNTATEAVESITVNYPKRAWLNTDAFVNMTNLRLLEFHSVDDSDDADPLHQDLKFPSAELRCLIWQGYPLQCFPSNFYPKNLVELDLGHSCIEQLWEGTKPLEKLEVLNLCYCPLLKKTPDFTTATNLGNLTFHWCTSLLEIHPSLSTLKNLLYLDLSYCNRLEILPSIKGMKSLKTLDLSFCSKLYKFPDIPEVMEKLSELYLHDTAIKELPPSINNLTGLETLDLRNCKQLDILPSSIHMASLKVLILSDCSKLVKFPEISEVMKNLSELHVDATAVTALPASIDNLHGLVVLNLHGCRELKSFGRIIHMRSLRTLDVYGCLKLEKFPEIPEVMAELQALHLEGTAIKKLPSSINNLTGVAVLNLRDCTELTSLPSSIHHMRSLQTLEHTFCSNLEKFPEISLITEESPQLLVLNLLYCTSLKILPSSIHHMRSLRTLNLSGCSKLEKFPVILVVMEKLLEIYLNGTAIKELPSSINNLTGLVTLELKNCRQLEILPSSIHHMKSLQTLNLSGCSKLEKFPEILEVMEKLLEIYLNGTAIKELPSSINNLTGLVTWS